MTIYRITPMTEEELNKVDLVDEGIYDFVVMKTEAQMSKNNNPMLKLTLKYWDKKGDQHFIDDYLVFGTSKFTIRKIKHFCDAVGLVNEYNQGAIPDDLNGKTGKLILQVKDGEVIPVDKLKGKPLGTCYPAKNSVNDYVHDALDKSLSKQDNAVRDEFDDAIPF